MGSNCQGDSKAEDGEGRKKERNGINIEAENKTVKRLSELKQIIFLDKNQVKV